MMKTLQYAVALALMALGGYFLITYSAFAQASGTVSAIKMSDISGNWAGYVANSASQYTAVGGSWNVPMPQNLQTSLATDATWVGIGGVKSNDLIQAGTQAILNNGSVTYQAWYEMLPDYQTILPLAVHGGDSVSVSLTEIATNTWYLTFTNNTTSQTYSTTLHYDSSLSSAEWIEEMPVAESGRSISYLPLDNFGTVTFSGAYTMANGVRENLSQSDAQALTMAGRGGVLASPSSLFADDQFSVTRGSAQTAQSTQQVSATGYTGRSRHGGGFGRGSVYVVVTYR